MVDFELFNMNVTFATKGEVEFIERARSLMVV